MIIWALKENNFLYSYLNNQWTSNIQKMKMYNHEQKFHQCPSMFLSQLDILKQTTSHVLLVAQKRKSPISTNHLSCLVFGSAQKAAGNFIFLSILFFCIFWGMDLTGRQRAQSTKSPDVTRTVTDCAESLLGSPFVEAHAFTIKCPCTWIQESKKKQPKNKTPKCRRGGVKCFLQWV